MDTYKIAIYRGIFQYSFETIVDSETGVFVQYAQLLLFVRYVRIILTICRFMREGDKKVMDDTIIHDDKIQECIYQFCIDNGLKSLRDATQNEFIACLLYVKRQLFSHGELKKSNGYYDIDLLTVLLDYLIQLTLVNNKVLTITAFLSFTGVSFDAFNQWEKIDTKYRTGQDKYLTVSHYELTQKLRRFSEESVQGLLTDKGKNPVGAMAILNHRFGWNVISGVNNRQDSKPQLAARDDLEKLAANDAPPPALPEV